MQDKSLWILSINSTAEIVVEQAGSFSSPPQQSEAQWFGFSQEASLLLL